MCCRTALPLSSGPHRRTHVALLTGLLLLASIASTGCGRKGDPLPPLRTVPQATNDLTIRQQGPLILLSMGYPGSTTGGQALGGVDAIELYELARPVEDPAAELKPLDARVFEGGAQLLTTLRGADLGATVTGNRIEIRLPLEQPLPAEPQALHFAVRAVKGDERSGLSNRVAMIPIAPPTAPHGLQAEAQPQGVVLRWGFEGEEPEGFDIFRRDAQNRGYGDRISRVGGDTRVFVDQRARFGSRYIYTVRTVARVLPLIYSADAGEREVDFQDRFAPPLPERFVALGERGSVRLRWDASEAQDVAGYLIFRRAPGRDFEQLFEDPLDATEFVDTGLAAGLRYDYRIRVVDESGNQSALSEPVDAVVR